MIVRKEFQFQKFQCLLFVVLSTINLGAALATDSILLGESTQEIVTESSDIDANARQETLHSDSYARTSSVPVVVQEKAKPSDSNDVWLVNTRCLGCPKNRCGAFQNFRMHRQNHCQWRSASVDEFVSTLDPGEVVCVFVDGNRVDRNNAVKRGFDFRRRLGDCGRDIRFVIWSWPSDKVTGPVRDAQQKAVRADCEAFYLASWLTNLPEHQAVSLVGYSLGARVVTGGTHLLSGERYYGNSIGQRTVPRPRMILLGAAIPCDWLRPNRPNGHALAQADKSLSVYNTKDRVLKWFPVVSVSKKKVIGHRPIDVRGLPGHLYQINVAKRIGRSHDIDDYAGNFTIRTIRSYALFVN